MIVSTATHCRKIVDYVFSSSTRISTN